MPNDFETVPLFRAFCSSGHSASQGALTTGHRLPLQANPSFVGRQQKYGSNVLPSQRIISFFFLIISSICNHYRFRRWSNPKTNGTNQTPIVQNIPSPNSAAPSRKNKEAPARPRGSPVSPTTVSDECRRVIPGPLPGDRRPALVEPTN